MFDKRQELSISFSLRTHRTEGFASLNARLTLNEKRTPFYPLGIKVPIEAWDGKRQRVDPSHPMAEVLMQRINKVRIDHERILLYQQTQLEEFKPTAESVKKHWIAKTPQGPGKVTLIDVFERFMIHVERLPKGEKRSHNTVLTYKNAQKHMLAFLQKERQMGLFAEEVTTAWGRRFNDFLLAKGLNRTSASKPVIHVRMALQHALDYEIIRTNGLFQYRPQVQKRKVVNYLSDDKLAELWSLDYPAYKTTAHVRNWALFMCYTGLDYHDALRLTENPAKYFCRTPAGDTFVYQRLKFAHAPQWGECHIPILNVTKELLVASREWKRPSIGVLNKHLRKIGDRMKLPFSFHSKICRKTAGTYFLLKFGDIYAVQKLLGHASVEITESHYALVQPQQVHQAMAKKPELFGGNINEVTPANQLVFRAA